MWQNAKFDIKTATNASNKGPELCKIALINEQKTIDQEKCYKHIELICYTK